MSILLLLLFGFVCGDVPADAVSRLNSQRVVLFDGFDAALSNTRYFIEQQQTPLPPPPPLASTSNSALSLPPYALVSPARDFNLSDYDHGGVHVSFLIKSGGWSGPAGSPLSGAQLSLVTHFAQQSDNTLLLPYRNGIEFVFQRSASYVPDIRSVDYDVTVVARSAVDELDTTSAGAAFLFEASEQAADLFLQVTRVISSETDFAARDASIKLGDGNGVLASSAAWSVELLYRHTSTNLHNPGQPMHMLNMYTNSFYSGDLLELYIDAGAMPSVCAVLHNGTSTATACALDPATGIGDLVHVAVVVDAASQLELYLQGALAASASLVGFVTAPSGPLYTMLGNRDCCPTRVFSGILDEFAFTPSALSPAVVACHHNNSVVRQRYYTSSAACAAPAPTYALSFDATPYVARDARSDAGASLPPSDATTVLPLRAPMLTADSAAVGGGALLCAQAAQPMVYPTATFTSGFTAEFMLRRFIDAPYSPVAEQVLVELASASAGGPLALSLLRGALALDSADYAFDGQQSTATVDVAGFSSLVSPARDVNQYANKWDVGDQETAPVDAVLVPVLAVAAATQLSLYVAFQDTMGAGDGSKFRRLSLAVTSDESPSVGSTWQTLTLARASAHKATAALETGATVAYFSGDARVPDVYRLESATFASTIITGVRVRALNDSNDHIQFSYTSSDVICQSGVCGENGPVSVSRMTLVVDETRASALRFVVDAGSGRTAMERDAPALDDGQWHHVAAVYDAAQTHYGVFVDGEQLGAWQTLVGASVADTSSSALAFGICAPRYACVDTACRRFVGMLDELALHDAPLEACALAARARNGLSRRAYAFASADAADAAAAACPLPSPPLVHLNFDDLTLRSLNTIRPRIGSGDVTLPAAGGVCEQLSAPSPGGGAAAFIVAFDSLGLSSPGQIVGVDRRRYCVDRRADRSTWVRARVRRRPEQRQRVLDEPIDWLRANGGFWQSFGPEARFLTNENDVGPEDVAELIGSGGVQDSLLQWYYLFDTYDQGALGNMPKLTYDVFAARSALVVEFDSVHTSACAGGELLVYVNDQSGGKKKRQGPTVESSLVVYSIATAAASEGYSTSFAASRWQRVVRHVSLPALDAFEQSYAHLWVDIKLPAATSASCAWRVRNVRVRLPRLATRVVLWANGNEQAYGGSADDVVIDSLTVTVGRGARAGDGVLEAGAQTLRFFDDALDAPTLDANKWSSDAQLEPIGMTVEPLGTSLGVNVSNGALMTVAETIDLSRDNVGPHWSLEAVWTPEEPTATACNLPHSVSLAMLGTCVRTYDGEVFMHMTDGLSLQLQMYTARSLSTSWYDDTVATLRLEGDTPHEVLDQFGAIAWPNYASNELYVAPGGGASGFAPAALNLRVVKQHDVVRVDVSVATRPSAAGGAQATTVVANHASSCALPLNSSALTLEVAFATRWPATVADEETTLLEVFDAAAGAAAYDVADSLLLYIRAPPSAAVGLRGVFDGVRREHEVALDGSSDAQPLLAAFTDGAAHVLTAVVDADSGNPANSLVALYLDGAPLGVNDTLVGRLARLQVFDVRVGARGDGGSVLRRAWPGLIDEVALTAGAASPAAVAARAHLALGGACYDCDATLSLPASTYRWSFDAAPTSHRTQRYGADGTWLTTFTEAACFSGGHNKLALVPIGGAIRWSPGLVGGGALRITVPPAAVVFDTRDFLASTSSLTAFAIEAVVRVRGSGLPAAPAAAAIFSVGRGASLLRLELRATAAADGTVELAMRVGADAFVATLAPAVAAAYLLDARPHHVVASIDTAARTLRLFLDGARFALYTAGDTPAAPAALRRDDVVDVALGNDADDARRFGGALDEVAVYDQAVSSCQVLYHYVRLLGPARDSPFSAASLAGVAAACTSPVVPRHLWRLERSVDSLDGAAASTAADDALRVRLATAATAAAAAAAVADGTYRSLPLTLHNGAVVATPGLVGFGALALNDDVATQAARGGADAGARRGSGVDARTSIVFRLKQPPAAVANNRLCLSTGAAAAECSAGQRRKRQEAPAFTAGTFSSSLSHVRLRVSPAYPAAAYAGLFTDAPTPAPTAAPTTSLPDGEEPPCVVNGFQGLFDAIASGTVWTLCGAATDPFLGANSSVACNVTVTNPLHELTLDPVNGALGIDSSSPGRRRKRDEDPFPLLINGDEEVRMTLGDARLLKNVRFAKFEDGVDLAVLEMVPAAAGADAQNHSIFDASFDPPADSPLIIEFAIRAGADGAAFGLQSFSVAKFEPPDAPAVAPVNAPPPASAFPVWAVVVACVAVLIAVALVVVSVVVVRQQRALKRERAERNAILLEALGGGATAAADTTDLSLAAKWIIDPSDVQKDKKLAEGGYGEVWKGRWRGVTVAIKVVKGVDAEARKQLILEAEALQNLHPHPNVVLFYGLCPLPLMVLLQFCDGGSLDAALYGGSRRTFSEAQMRVIVLGAARGVAHLHEEGIIHRDLAARNVLLKADDTACLTDFGMSRMGGKDEENTTKTNVGPLRWMAPEQMKDQVVSASADMFAFGVVLYEVYAREMPWSGMTNVEAAAKVLGGEYLTAPADAPSVVRDLMLGLFATDPKQRPAAQEVVKRLEAAWELSGGGGDSYTTPPPPTTAPTTSVASRRSRGGSRVSRHETSKRDSMRRSRSDSRTHSRDTSRRGSRVQRPAATDDDNYTVPPPLSSTAASSVTIGGSEALRRSSQVADTMTTAAASVYETPPPRAAPKPKTRSRAGSKRQSQHEHHHHHHHPQQKTPSSSALAVATTTPYDVPPSVTATTQQETSAGSLVGALKDESNYEGVGGSTASDAGYEEAPPLAPATNTTRSLVSPEDLDKVYEAPPLKGAGAPRPASAQIESVYDATPQELLKK